MTGSQAEPPPVPVRRYRYSKWRWRVLVRLFDVVGGAGLRAWRLVRSRPVVDDPRRILVVQLDHLGDAVLTTPMFPRLREAYPDAAIDVLASPSNRAVFEADPLVDRVIVADRSWFDRRPGRSALVTAVWGLGRQIRERDYDLGIDVRGDVLSLMVLALGGVRRRVGWRMGGGAFLLTDEARWQPGRHEVRSRLALLEAIGLASDDPVRVRVHVEDRDRSRMAQLLSEAWPSATSGRPSRRRSRQRVARGPFSTSRAPRAVAPSATATVDPESLHAGRFGVETPLLVAHLGAGTAAKRWPIRHWRTLIGRFLDRGWRVVAIGGADDVGLAAGIGPHPDFRDWTGRLAVPETTALLERADLFLGADSGPAHLAACAGVPSVVLFSGTNLPRQWRPWSRRSLVLKRRVGCRPCHRKVCPLADHPCLAGLTPDRVERAARRWWSRLHRDESPHAPL